MPRLNRNYRNSTVPVFLGIPRNPSKESRGFDRYAFPGAYECFGITSDGAVLCIPCINDRENPIHFSGESDGWLVSGFDCVANNDSEIVCDHCNYEIQAEDDFDA
jgi:hypothetical protein